MAEPVEVRLLQGERRLRLVYAVPESRVQNQPRRDVLVDEPAVQLEGIRNRYAMILAATLNQRRCARLPDGRDR